MLIPQFSLRWLLAAVTLCSLAFLVVSLAVRGHLWAIGASIALLSLVVVALVHGFTFFLVWLFATTTGRRKSANTPKAILWLLCLFSSARVYAGGAVHTLPPIGAAPNGMTLTVDTTWPEGFGYRPITFSVACAPSTADRTLSFEFRYHDWNPENAQLKATTDLDIPAGATTASTTIAVPDFTYWQGYSLETWEDGRHIKQLSAVRMNAGGGFAGYRATSNSMPAVLCVAAAQPDVTSLSSLFPRPQYGGVTVPSGAAVFPTEWSWRAPASLPDQWLCFQSLDVILISVFDLRNLTTSPKVLDAIRDWTRAGGNLLVYGVGTDWAALEDIDRLLKLPPDGDGQTSGDWKSPLPAHFSPTFTDFVSPNVQVSQIAQVDETGNVVVTPSGETPPAEVPFRLRTIQQGAIVAIADLDPFANTFDQRNWHWMFNSLGSPRWLGAKRLGVSASEENPDFWTFLIPGVGVAPVDAYRVLITAFVVVIGPINYLLLRKHGRLHLLLLTVPVSAILVTAALLGYALVSDGLQSRVRSRSLTLLDQRSGDAATWSRLTYYSGLAPSRGLRFGRDTAVIPFEHLPTGAGGAEIRRAIEIEPDHQQLSRGWLPSRTPTQYVNIRPYSTPKKLQVSAGANSSMVVENQLGVKVQHLLVRGEDGQYGYGAKLVQGAKVPLNLVEAKDTMPAATAAMRKAFDDQALVLPPGFASQPNYGLFGFQRRMIYRAMGGNPVSVTQNSGRLEKSLEDAKSAVRQAGVSGDSTALTPRSYVAIVDRPEEVAIGIEGATEIEGLHVIRGSW